MSFKRFRELVMSNHQDDYFDYFNVAFSPPPAKRPKIEVKEEVLDELSALELLPELIIGEIISNLGHEDALKVFLVSKKLNQVMSDSPQIMSRFAFKFPRSYEWDLKNVDGTVQEKFYAKIFRVRKYPKIVFAHGSDVRGDYVPFVENFLKSHGQFAKHIKIGSQSTHWESIPSKLFLTKLLKLCRNVEILEVYGGGWAPSSFAPPMDLPNLKKLTFPPSLLLNLFSNCKLESLEISTKWPHLSMNDYIESFLFKQQHIQHLEIPYSQGLFEDVIFMKAAMRLESLTVRNVEANLEVEPNEAFKLFLNIHAATLTKLKLIRANNFMKYFSNFRHIKELTVDGDAKPIIFNVRMPSVERLTIINCASIAEIPENFPNVKAISLQSCLINENFLMHMPQVEEFSVESCTESIAFSLSKLKRLKIKKTSMFSFMNFNFEDNQLKELIIIGWLKWTATILEKLNTKLDYLKIVGKSIVEKENLHLQNAIECNRHKIERLIMSEN